MNIPELVQQLNSTDETHQIEAKRGSALGNSFFETVCAFANEPGMGGGYILLGAVRDEAELFPFYKLEGVANSDELQQQIASGCRTKFNTPIRPNIKAQLVKGKILISVFIHESAASEKPVYFAGKKLPEGAYRRVGPTDQVCTDDDLVVLYGERQSESFDKTPLLDAGLSDLDEDAIKHYRFLKSNARPGADDLLWNNQDLLRSLNAIKLVDNVWRPTVTGIMLFGSQQTQRMLLPMMRVDYIRINGKEWVEDPVDRFYTVDMRGPLLQLVQRVQNTIADDLPRGFLLPEGQVQAESLSLSTRVLREAIVNALMHRSYRMHSTIQVIRYSNRIEIINPGYSLKAEELLGEPGSESRNPYISNIFYETSIAENKGSGIRAMRNLMQAAKFSPPTFESDRKGNRFITRLLLQHFLGPKDLSWLIFFTKFNLNDNQKKSLIFLRETGALDNRTYRQINSVDMYAATKDLRMMRDVGLLEMKGLSSATYYVAGIEYIKSVRASTGSADLSSSPSYAKEGDELSYIPKGLVLSDELARRIRDVRVLRAVPPILLRSIIVELCSIKPLTSLEISHIVNRKNANLREKYLTPMIRDGILKHTIEDNPFSVKQAYKVAGI